MGIKTLDALFEYINKHNRPPRKHSLSKELVSSIYDQTQKFLPEDASLRERIFCLYHNLTERPLCPVCKTNKLRFNDEKFRYAYGCSQKCIQKNKVVRQKAEETNLRKYGVRHSMQSDSVKQKAKQSLLEHYGVDHPMKSDIIKQKIKKTNLERYGVESYSKTQQFKDFMKSFMQSDKGQQILAKSRSTNNIRYGVDYPLQNDNLRRNALKAFTEAYKATNPIHLEHIKEKFKQTMKNRYNVYWNGQRLEVRQKLSKLFKEKAEYFRIKQFKRWWTYSKPIIEEKCNVEFLFNFDNFVYSNGTTKHSYYRFKCKKCGHVFETYLSNGHLPLCPKCNKNHYTQIEKACINFIESLSFVVQHNVRMLDIDDYLSLAEAVKLKLLS